MLHWRYHYLTPFHFVLPVTQPFHCFQFPLISTHGLSLFPFLHFQVFPLQIEVEFPFQAFTFQLSFPFFIPFLYQELALLMYLQSHNITIMALGLQEKHYFVGPLVHVQAHHFVALD